LLQTFVFVPPESMSVLLQGPRRNRLEIIGVAVASAGSVRRAPFSTEILLWAVLEGGIMVGLVFAKLAQLVQPMLL
jgi:hypothetical protein